MKKAFIQLHIAVFLAGFTGLAGKLIELNEGLLVWYRLLITSITMWILFYFTRKLRRVHWRDILKLTAVGFLSAMHWVTFYGSIKESNISVALVCFSSVGFFTALFEPLLSKKKMNVVEILLGLLVMTGIYIIFQFDPKYKNGIILGVSSAVLLAVSMIYFKYFVGKLGPETTLTYQLSGALISLTVVMPVYLYQFPTGYIIPDLEDWMWLLGLSWFCSVVAFQLTGHAIKKLSAFTVNLTFNLEPVYGIFLAFIVYKENKLLSQWFFLGFSIIALSLIIHIVLLLKEARKRDAYDLIESIPSKDS
ncbi:MAG: DMT family transporter [Chitinophagaceae bacterium]|nr:DMT family transporter [Chitinophagaceae bacterium]